MARPVMVLVTIMSMSESSSPAAATDLSADAFEQRKRVMLENLGALLPSVRLVVPVDGLAEITAFDAGMLIDAGKTGRDAGTARLACRAASLCNSRWPGFAVARDRISTLGRPLGPFR